ncbi:MAG: zinc ribbon domain-containing protein [Chloroflexi bacterium]|nr:zinc ribbon domain-containing protein [Chloroflexota bacterium]
MKLRYWLLLLVAVTSLALGRHTQTALAQTDNETVRFKNAALWIYPEFDDPRLLVMLEGNLDGAEAPVRVRFLVPAIAEMFAAGSKDAQGEYSGGPPDRKASEIPGWDEISYELKTNTFRVEYYDSSIFGRPDKTISYDFRTISPISNLRVTVQQPKKSTNFSVTPRGVVGADGEGFTTYSYSFNNLTADADPLHFEIAYTRAETKPSISPGGGLSTGLIIGLALGVIVIGAGIVWILKARQTQRVPVRESRQQRRQAARKGGSGNLFCTRCGQQIAASDKFCPYCGNKV